MTDAKAMVLAVLSDLMFTVKIQAAAKQAGMHPVFVSKQEDALARAKERPSLIILDLNHAAGNPLGTIEALKGDEEAKRIALIGFVSHVQTDLIKAAQEKGCEVMARSAFSQNLPAILQKYTKAA